MSEYTPDKGSVEMHYVTGAVAANPGLTQIQARDEFEQPDEAAIRRALEG